MTFKVGDKVSVADVKYPGVWIVRSIGRVNALLDPVDGGRALRAPMYLLAPPTDADRQVKPLAFFVVGEIVRVEEGKFAGLWVVIADKGGDRVNIAKLGGDADRYVRMARQLLVKVDVKEVLK